MTYAEGQSYLADDEEATNIESTTPEDKEVKRLRKKVEDQVRNIGLYETNWRLPGVLRSLREPYFALLALSYCSKPFLLKNFS